MTNLETEFAELLETTIQGASISTAELAAYAAEKTAKLKGLVGQAGYHDAVIAVRDSIALKAGIAATEQADAADSKILGVIEGALFMGAKVLAGGSPA
jgi:hypothetical protein